jgi:hypothetical protein
MDTRAARPTDDTVGFGLAAFVVFDPSLLEPWSLQ